MKEKHLYTSTPEAGFEERLVGAVERFFVRDRNTDIAVFQTRQMLRNFPELKENPEFVQRIGEAAKVIYDHRFSQK